MEWRKGVVDALEGIVEHQKYLSLSLSQLNELESLRDDIEDPFTLLVAGEFKSGKSLFINAFLGEEILTSDVTPATAILTKIKYGEKRELIAHFKNGSKESFPIEWMNKLTAESDDELGSQLRATITMVELFLPISMLKQVTLVDSPGLQAGVEQHNEVTESFLTRPDYVLWVFDYHKVGKDTENKVLTRFKKMNISVAGIINKIDLHDPTEQSMEDYYDFINRRLQGLVTYLLGVSAKSALRGKQLNSEELLESSNWGQLEKHLNSTINNPIHKTKRTFDRLTSICQKVNRKLIELKPNILDDTSLLVPFQTEDYPTIMKLQQDREDQLNRLTDYQNEIIALSTHQKKSMDELFLSVKKLDSLYERIDVTNPELEANLEEIMYVTNMANKMLQSTLNTISTYENEKLELDQMRQALSGNWEEIKDAKFFKRKKTQEFQLALLDYQKKNEAAALKCRDVIYQNQILVSDVKKIKHQSESITNELLDFSQKQKQIVCNIWNANLRTYTNKYRDVTSEDIKKSIQWLEVVLPISKGLSQVVIPTNSTFSDSDSYRDFKEQQQLSHHASETYGQMLPIFEKFEHFYKLKSVQSKGVPEIHFPLDINSDSFIHSSQIEPLPDYTPKKVLQRIELNRKRFIMSTCTLTLILAAAYLLL